MYDFETASAVLRDMERDRRHFRVKTAKRQEQVTAHFAGLRKRVEVISPAFAAMIRRFRARF